MTIHVRAYAKLNLSLRVVNRRDDGFHEILSDVQTIDLADRLSFDVGGEGVRVENDLPIDGPDIAERAASALLRRKGVNGGVVIRVTKGIPAGAGLGGGSSDAAAVLAVLDRRMRPTLGRDVLCKIGAAIGSDVPLFLHGGRLRMGGRGECIERLSGIGARHFVVIVPPIHCDTAQIYARWDELADGESNRGAESPVLGENDLLQPALDVHPDLCSYNEAIGSAGGKFHGMSGSGSSFYAAFDDPQAAQHAYADLAKRLETAAIFLCRPTTEGHLEGEWT